MNSSVRVNDLQRWQMCAGMCLVCGQPMGLSEATTRASKQDDQGEEDAELGNLEKLSLMEECPVRLCMMRFRMLGKREECHIIDRYTHLEKGSMEERFDRVVEKRKENVGQVGMPYQEPLHKMLKSEQFQYALAIGRRVAKPLTFSGCRACNMAMEKASAHANTVFRCFPLTSRVNIANLEENTLESIKIKKILEQIALFFVWNDKEREWMAKSDDRLLEDACLWRCIAHLYCWGRNTTFRSRLVAVFHAANYLFQKSSWKGSLILEDWHIHVFQPFYMQEYTTQPQNTWFGTMQGEAAAMLDLARTDGMEWSRWVQNKLDVQVLPKLELWAEREVHLDKIQTFKERIIKGVQSEKDLFTLAISKRGTERGLRSLCAFYLYNVKEETQYAQHFERFLHALGQTLLSKSHRR